MQRAVPRGPIAVPRRLPRLATPTGWAVLAVGGALGWLVGHDGTPAWQVARVAVVVVLAAATWRPVHDGWRPPAGARVLGGWLLTATGIGFVPHLVKQGATAVAIAGVVVVLGGLWLLGSGIAGLAAGRGRAVQIAGGAAVLAGAVLVASIVSPAVLAANVPRPAIGAGPASVGLDAETVALTTSDGVTLAGWYVPSTNGAAVVLRHGSGSTRSSVLRHAAVLARHGYGVLLVDARGHGESGGRAMGFGWYGERDAAAAVDHLAGRPDVDPDRIGVVGMSMGGEEAIGASGEDRRIRAVVAEGATARSAGDEAWLSDAYGLRGAVQERIEVVQDLFTGLLTEAPQPRSNRDAVARSQARYLLVAGGAVDEEVRTARDLRAKAPDRVEVWVVPGAGHTAGLRSAPEAWEATVVAFLDDALGTR